MKLLNSKTGVTVLEGVIALGLLAVVTAGAFGVLLSASRKSSQPDMHESMVLAVETAKNKLQVYIGTNYDDTAKSHIPSGLVSGLCGNDSDPFSVGSKHYITCMLPRICDQTSPKSTFYYQISEETDKDLLANIANKHREGSTERAVKLCNSCGSFSPTNTHTLKVAFTITCNGYEL